MASMIMEKLSEIEVKLVSGDFSNMLLLDIQKLCNETVEIASLQSCMSLLDFIVKADYGNVIESDVFGPILDVLEADTGLASSDGYIFSLSELLKNYVARNDSNSYVVNVKLLCLGISFLQEFIQCNWTGPCVGDTKTFISLQKLLDKLGLQIKDITHILSLNGIATYSNTKNPELLLFSKILLMSVNGTLCPSQRWWSLRCSIVHQHILTERSIILHKDIEETIKLIESHLGNHFIVDPMIKLQFFIEAGMAHLLYQNVSSSRKYFNEAQKMAKLNVEMSGAFGKRTQFQQTPVPQLMIKLQRFGPTKPVSIPAKIKDMPSNCVLQDDVLLSKVKFMDESDNNVEDLLPSEQLVIMSQCCLLQRSSASDELLEEQLMAYIDYLLAQQNVWPLHVKMLVMRCKIERHRSRKVERAMMQLEELLSALKKDVPHVSVRQFMFFSAMFPAYWLIEKDLADLLISLGAVKSALEIYQRLELWDDVVGCYQILEQKEKAADLVRQQIKEKGKPYLYCILGDVTDDVECYHKAWELSDGRSTRSQTSLGYFYYKQGNYPNCIKYFEKSLELNHLQPHVWFSLAFAATQTENYDLASQAYRHVVTLDPDNFEAWNNLSNAYIKMKQKNRAYRALQEALKCNYEHWRVWENFLVVCIDIGAFEDAIHSYHRLLDIRKKHEDAEILGILVKAVTSDVSDFAGHPASQLKKKLLQLFGRVTSVVTNNDGIWKCYALLYSSDADYTKSAEVADHVVRYLQKGLKCATQKPQWEKSTSLCKEAISDAITLAEAYVVYLNLAQNGEKSQAKTSARLTLRNLVVRIEKQFQDFHQKDVKELNEHLSVLKNHLDVVESM